MALTDSIPTIVSAAILEALRKNLVYSRLFNEDYQGDVSYGHTVRIPSIGSVTVSDYAQYTPLSWQEVEDTAQDLSIDQQKSFSIVIDDIDSVQARPEILAPYAREAAYQMASTIDEYLAGVVAAGAAITDGLGTDGTPLEVDDSNVLATLLRMGRLLDEAKVPRAGRVVVVPPWFVEAMSTAKIDVATDNTDAVQNGYVTRFGGFDVLMSRNVPNDSGDKYKIVAGSSISSTMALQINKTENIRLQDYFGDGLRGLAVYGARVTRPAALAVGTFNEATGT